MADKSIDVTKIPAPPVPGTDAYRNLPEDPMANGYIDTLAWNNYTKRWEKTSLLAASNGSYITETTWHTRTDKLNNQKVSSDTAKSNTSKTSSSEKKTKVKKDVSAKPEITILSAKDIDPTIDPGNVQAYLDPKYHDAKTVKNAQLILNMMQSGELDSAGNPITGDKYAGLREQFMPGYVPETGPVAGARIALSEQEKKQEAIRQEQELSDVNNKIQQNVNARNKGYLPPYPDLGFSPKKITDIAATSKPAVTSTAATSTAVTSAAKPTTSAASAAWTAAAAEARKPKVSGTGAGGGMGGVSSTGTGAGGNVKVPVADPNKTMWVSYIRQTFKTLPADQRIEIENLLKTATAQGWAETQFLDELYAKTKWGRTELPTFQRFFIEQNDPRKASVFKQDVINNQKAVQNKLEALGVDVSKVDPVTGKVMTTDEYMNRINAVTIEMMKNGWNADSQGFQDYLAKNVDVIFTGGGTVGSTLGRVKNQANLYGIKIDDNYAKQINNSLLDPNDGRDEAWWYKEMQRQAADAYAPFAEGINQGRTLYDMTTNYRTQMSNLLEVDPNSISWKDLMGYALKDDGKGNQVKKTAMEFNSSVKQNPLWQKTKNARDTYFSVADDILKEFGITG